MNFIFLFSIGLINTTLELHLLTYNLSNLIITLCFLLLTVAYVFFTFFGSYIFQKADERTIIFIGIIILGIGFLMLAPWKIILPNELWIVIVSLVLISLGQSMIFRNLYLVPSIPHMVSSAVDQYRYANDDILTDALSGLGSFARSSGAIAGPIFAAVLINIFGYEMTISFIGFGFFAYGLVYLIGSGLIVKWLSKEISNSARVKTAPFEENISLCEY